MEIGSDSVYNGQVCVSDSKIFGFKIKKFNPQ
jgi:hypothetical protein